MRVRDAMQAQVAGLAGDRLAEGCLVLDTR
jgi:hypothetical protein